jgi:hypothetical protein
MIKTRMNIDICYIISHGFAARMLLQTGLILRLAEQGKSIAIITPDPKDSNLQSLANNPLIHIFDPHINQTIWDDDYGVKRRYYLEEIKSNPVFWEKHIHSIFYTASKHPWKRIRPFIYYPIYKLIPYFPSIRRRFKAKEDKYLISEKASQLLEKINPKLVVSTYPVNFLEAKFLFAAKKQGRRTLIHLLSWDNITSKGIFPVIPDEFIAWGKIMYKELKEYYQLSDEQVQVCGVPHFDHHIKIKKAGIYKDLIAELGLNPDLPYLFVAMSSPRFAPYEIDIVEWLTQAIHDDIFGKDLQLVVRPHPQNVQGSMSDQRWIGRLDKLKGHRVAIDYPKLVKSNVRWSMAQSDMDHLSKLLLGCSVCINSGSTVSIDALVMGKPSLLTSFDGDKELYYWKSARRLVDYTHLQKFVTLGGAEITRSYDELEKSISTYINNPDHRIENRKNALHSECYQDDGKSTDRVIDAMLHLLEKLKV